MSWASLDQRCEELRELMSTPSSSIELVTSLGRLCRSELCRCFFSRDMISAPSRVVHVANPTRPAFSASPSAIVTLERSGVLQTMYPGRMRHWETAPRKAPQGAGLSTFTAVRIRPVNGRHIFCNRYNPPPLNNEFSGRPRTRRYLCLLAVCGTLFDCGDLRWVVCEI